MKKFALGAAAGMSALLLAAPVVLQVASAQGTASSSTAKVARAAPTQACLQAQVALEDANLANADALAAKHKAQLQKRRDALATVAAISDDTAREEALKKMRDDMQSLIKGTADDVPAAVTSAMEAVRTACGNVMMGGGMGMMKNGGGMLMMKAGPGGRHGTFKFKKGGTATSASSTSIQQ
ncbi:MAG TPA: hypothetical protein PKV72_05230 [Candidatus Peribacteria bacterium]|nr:hypothetical protein [Candidatus Peribacteria bacterium]